VISGQSRPRLAAKARLRFDRQTAQYILLYPERGLKLNPTAVATVRLCTGEHTVQEIIERLAEQSSSRIEEIQGQVLAFLGALANRSLIDVVT